MLPCKYSCHKTVTIVIQIQHIMDLFLLGIDKNVLHGVTFSTERGAKNKDDVNREFQLGYADMTSEVFPLFGISSVPRK